jgi:HlyD family secretion protein
MKRILIIGGIVVAFAALFAFNKLTTRKNSENVYIEAKLENFEITVTAAGELLAERSIDINGPTLTQSNRSGGGGQNRGMDMRFMDLKITDIVPEGTMVNNGDYIAQLDRTSYANSLKDALETQKTEQNTLAMKILDTAVVLTGLRDDIKNQNYVVEEATITLAQSKYEPPATIRQAEIALDKAKRSLEQKKKNYKLRVAQNLADINHQKIQHVERANALVEDLQEYLAKFTITAPGPGMVIYKKDRLGNKRKVGSSINTFDKVIATLPDLTSMLSKIYVNEIDINKVKVGQKVNIEVDALPTKAFTGSVISIANIGEVLPNSDAKMFEVIIRLNQNDPEIRPAMTTGNKIFIKTYENIVSIPTECVQTGPDSIPFVYLKHGGRQIVLMGEANEKNVVIEKGLEPGTALYLNVPADAENFKIKGQELIPEIRKR